MGRLENCLQAFINKWRKPKYAALFAIVVNVVLLGTITIIIIIEVNKNHGYTSGEQPVAEHDIEDRVKQVTSSTEETSRVENLYRAIENIYNTTGNLGKAAAHVFIDTSSSYTGDDESTLTWRQDMDAAFVSDKISYKDGGLTVKEGGYYYIYSQIVYSGNGSREFASGWILHTVVKQTASELEDIMRNRQSIYSIRRGRPAYTTSSLGATFYLEANTRVKVMSSVPGNIHVGAPQSNYFGMFLI